MYHVSMNNFFLQKYQPVLARSFGPLLYFLKFKKTKHLQELFLPLLGLYTTQKTPHLYLFNKFRL